ncbi:MULTISPECIES: cupin domain-containing protein [unclassified Streptomyces]|uniref:cupin domain-containing protein n=1 Tax=unclassified Streptomyces TaxID=2593676 RepID=UPI0036693F98
MMTHPHLAGLLTDLDAVIADAPADATGALWRLTGTGRGLDSNLIRLRPRAVIGEHAEPALDVLLVVVEGGGRMDTEDGPLDLRPHSAVWLARNARRSLTAGPDGLTYLTVHTRRPGLGIGTAAPGTPAARPAALPVPEGGEAACLLHRVCAGCGRPATESAARYCSRCGDELPD